MSLVEIYRNDLESIARNCVDKEFLIKKINTEISRGRLSYYKLKGLARKKAKIDVEELDHGLRIAITESYN